MTPSVRPPVVQRQGTPIACTPRPASRTSSGIWFHSSSGSRLRGGLGGAAAAASASSAPATASPAAAASSAATTVEGEREVRPGIWEGYWNWEGHRIRYQRSGGDPSAPAVLCVHG